MSTKTPKEKSIWFARRCQRVLAALALLSMAAFPGLLIYSIYTGQWNWRYFVINAICFLTFRFFNNAFGRAAENIKKENNTPV